MTALLSALQYGFAGLSAIMLVLSFRIIQTEQGKKIPRPEILRHSVKFMALALCQSIANIIVQILDQRADVARANTACAQALSGLQGAIQGKMLYEAAIATDHNPQDKTIDLLRANSDKSFKACGVQNPNEPGPNEPEQLLGRTMGSAAPH